MIDPKRTCGNCDYFTAGIPGHGTCHVAAPGSIARNGFPIIAAGDWCAKGATGGSEWMTSQEQETRQWAFGVLREERKETARLWGQLNDLMKRDLWQRICNAVPWEGK